MRKIKFLRCFRSSSTKESANHKRENFHDISTSQRVDLNAMGLLQSTFSGEEFLPVLSGSDGTVKHNLSTYETGSASQRATDLTSREDTSVKVTQSSHDTKAHCDEITKSCSDAKANLNATPSSVRRRIAVLSNHTTGKSCNDGNSTIWTGQAERKKIPDGFPDSQNSFCTPKQVLNKQRPATTLSGAIQDSSTLFKLNQIYQNQALDIKAINIREQQKSVQQGALKDSTTNLKPPSHRERSQGTKNSEAQPRDKQQDASKVSQCNQKPSNHTKPNQGTNNSQEQAKDKQQDVCKASLPNKNFQGHREPCQKSNIIQAKTKDKQQDACNVSLTNQKPSSLRESSQITNYGQEQNKDKQHNSTKASMTNKKPPNCPEPSQSTYNFEEKAKGKQTDSTKPSVTKQKLSSQGTHYTQEQAVNKQQYASKSIPLKSQTSQGHLEPKTKHQQAVTLVKTCRPQMQEPCTKPKTEVAQSPTSDKTTNKGVANQTTSAEIKIGSSKTQEQDLRCSQIISPNKDTQFASRSIASNCTLLNNRNSTTSPQLQTCCKPPLEVYDQHSKESPTPKGLHTSPKVTVSTPSLVNKSIVSSDCLGSKIVIPSKDVKCTGVFIEKEKTCVSEDKKSNHEATKKPDRKTVTNLIDCTKRIESDGLRQFSLVGSKEVSSNNPTPQVKLTKETQNVAAALKSKETVKANDPLLNRKDQGEETCYFAQENLDERRGKESCSNKGHTAIVANKDSHSVDPVLKDEHQITPSPESPTNSSKKGSIKNWSTSDVRELENKLAYRVIKRSPQNLQTKRVSSQNVPLKSGHCGGGKKSEEQRTDKAKNIKAKVLSQLKDSPAQEQRTESTLTKDSVRGSPLMRLSMKHKNINLPKPSGALTIDKKPLKVEGVLQAQLTLSGSSDSQKDTNQSHEGKDQSEDSRSRPNDQPTTQNSGIPWKAADDPLKSTIILDQLAERLEKLNITSSIVIGNGNQASKHQASPEVTSMKECPTNSSQQRSTVEGNSKVISHQPVSYSMAVRSVPSLTLTQDANPRKGTVLGNVTNKETATTQPNCQGCSSILSGASSKSVQTNPKNDANSIQTTTRKSQVCSSNLHQINMVANTSGKDTRNLSESKGMNTTVEKDEKLLKCFAAGSKVVEKSKENTSSQKEAVFLNVSNSKTSTLYRGMNTNNSALPTQTAIKPQTDVKTKLLEKDQEFTLNETHGWRSSTTSIQSKKQCSSSHSPSDQKNVQPSNSCCKEPQTKIDYSMFDITNAKKSLNPATKPLSSTNEANILANNKQGVGLNSISELNVEELHGTQGNLTKKEVSSMKHENRFLGSLKHKMSSVFSTKKGKKTGDGKKAAAAVKVPSPPGHPPKPASDGSSSRETESTSRYEVNKTKQPFSIVNENKVNVSMEGFQFHPNKPDNTNTKEPISSAERPKVISQEDIPEQVGEVKSEQSVSTNVAATTERYGGGKCVSLEEKVKPLTQSKQTFPVATKKEEQEPSADKKGGTQRSATQVKKEYVGAKVEVRRNVQSSKAKSVSSEQFKVPFETAQNKKNDVPKGEAKGSSNSPIFVKSKTRKEIKPVAEVSQKDQGTQVQKIKTNQQESKMAATPHTPEKKEDAFFDHSRMVVEEKLVQDVDICAEVVAASGESTCVGASPSKKAERRERRRLKRQQKRAMERMLSEQGETVCEESSEKDNLIPEATESNSSTKTRNPEIFQATPEKYESLPEKEDTERVANNEENFLEIENPLAAINLTPLKGNPVSEASPQSKTSRRRGGRRRRGKYEYSTPVSRRKPINCCCEVVCEYCSSPRDD